MYLCGVVVCAVQIPRGFHLQKHKILKLVVLALDKTQYIVYTDINEQMFVLFCGVVQWEFAGLIIRKSQVRFLPPQPLGIEPGFRKNASERELYTGCKSPPTVSERCPKECASGWRMTVVLFGFGSSR